MASQITLNNTSDLEVLDNISFFSPAENGQSTLVAKYTGRHISHFPRSPKKGKAVFQLIVDPFQEFGVETQAGMAMVFGSMDGVLHGLIPSYEAELIVYFTELPEGENIALDSAELFVIGSQTSSSQTF